MFVRFSTVIHPSGSPETLRDPRGFALKFYTDEGNWDLVGNNLPVFFIRDAIKFPDMVHSLKPSPITNKQDPNRFFDFFSHQPESTHMLTQVYSDLGIPASYRQMDGHGVHSFKFVNAKGEYKYVKFNWASQQGVKGLNTPDEVARTVGAGLPARHHGPVRRHRRREVPLVGAVGAGAGPEGPGEVQLRPARRDEGVARGQGARHQAGQIHAEQDAGQLLRGDRAGGVLPRRHAARASSPPRTGCCRAASSPTRTRSATASAPTTSRCPSTAPRRR